jgi:ABC-type multidrug transport system fused ATPase/permease subunit
VYLLLGVMLGMAAASLAAAVGQQLVTAWLGNRLLLRLRTEMYDHMQGLSLSFYDEMEVAA